MMRPKTPRRTYSGVMGSPSSVMEVFDGYGLMGEPSSTTEPPTITLKSCETCTKGRMPMPARAHQFNEFNETSSPTDELGWNDANGRTAERERSTLTDLILQRNWSEARQRLASEEHEHEIYECVPMTFASHDTSHALPLHLACALRPLPPSSFIRFLLKLHPDAARFQEETWGLLPIHFAANISHSKERRNVCFDFDLTGTDNELLLAGNALDTRERFAFNQKCIITSLVDAYPDSLGVKERFNGMLPIHIAASTASSEYHPLTSNVVYILELLIQKCPTSVDVMDDWGETPKDIAWRNATFNCLRCRVGGRFLASDHGRCPHVVPPRQGKTNPLLRQGFDCLFPFQESFSEDTKATTSVCGGTETTAMSDESRHLDSKAYSDTSRDSDLVTLASMESQMEDVKDTVIHLVTHNECSVSMQIRLESLHAGKGRPWSKKLRHKPPNPFFEVAVLQDNSSATGSTIYRSYPLMKTTAATWDKVDALDMKLDSCCSKKLRFRITVFDCDVKGGKHLLIGESEVYSADLARQTARLIPIKRDNKVKGFLRLVHFQLDSA